MTGNSAFELVKETGWRRGMRNLLDNELSRWWGTRAWWVQSLIWVGMISFIMAGVIFGSQTVKLDEVVMIYAIFGSLVPAIGIVIRMQDSVVGEKLSGTAAWVLSKPASRQSFILSKLAAGAMNSLATMVVFPGIAAYILLAVGVHFMPNPLSFLAALAILWVGILYFLTFSVMLGTLFNARGPVIGLPLALVLFQQTLLGLAPALKYILPWTLAAPLNSSSDALVPNLIQGNPVEFPLTLILVIVQIVIFVLVALWRFQQEEL